MLNPYILRKLRKVKMQNDNYNPTHLMRLQLNEAVKMFEANSEAMEVCIRQGAQLYKMRLDALMQNGFEREEAVRIIERRGVE